MQETDHQFQVPALEYTNDHLKSRVTEAINPCVFCFKNNLNIIHSQFDFKEPKTLEF